MPNAPKTDKQWDFVQILILYNPPMIFDGFEILETYKLLPENVFSRVRWQPK